MSQRRRRFKRFRLKRRETSSSRYSERMLLTPTALRTVPHMCPNPEHQGRRRKGPEGNLLFY